MKKNIIIVCLLAVISILILLDYSMNKNELVAVVGEQKIYSKDVETEINDKYYDMVLTNCINENLIFQAYKDSGEEYTEEDLENSLLDVQNFDNTKVSLDDEKTREFVEMYTMVVQLSDKYVISDLDLQEYVQSIEDQYGKLYYTTTAIYGSKDEIEEMKSIGDYDKIINYAKKNNIVLITRKEFELDNYFARELTNYKKGDIWYFDGDGESDEDAYSGMPAIVLVDDIENVEEDVLNIDKHREELIAAYCSEDYYQVKLSLENILQGVYDVKKL